MPVRILAPTPAALAEAARVIRSGGLVAFPTETVYGLGANALDGDAVEKIFAAKGRPASNPLIVHVASEAAARGLARRWPETAARLAAAHWPGPLTLVVEKTGAIPDRVTAGGTTVALRVPAHPVALALLQQSERPIAAPSANRSEEISPTTARHVAESLGPFVADLIVLDGGACTVGIESTVVDVTGEEPVVLRPGVLLLPGSPSAAAAAGENRPAGRAARSAPQDPAPARSPGQRARHYAPRKPLRLMRAGEPEETPRPGDARLVLPPSPEAAAQVLYAELRRLDAEPTVTRILVAEPPPGPAWDGIRDRLRRAAARAGEDDGAGED